MKRFLAIAALLALGSVALGPQRADATDTNYRAHDRQHLEVSTGTAAITTTAADFTAWQPVLTIVPDDGHALLECKVVIDLAKATTGFAAGYTSETISFSIARKVDGTNWRTASNKATATVTGTAAAGLCIELDLGLVSPDEDARIMVKLSAEGAANISLPYRVLYRAGTRATLTPS